MISYIEIRQLILILVILLFCCCTIEGQEDPEFVTEQDIKARNEKKNPVHTFITELNLCPGIGHINSGSYSVDNKYGSFGIKSAKAFVAGEYASIGIGLGIDRYASVTLIPITADFRFKLTSRKTSPVINFSPGYSIGIESDEKGANMGLSTGLNIYLSKYISMLLNVGYKMQVRQVTIQKNSITSTENANLSFLYLGLGISF